jgi:hypothetical protein
LGVGKVNLLYYEGAGSRQDIPNFHYIMLKGKNGAGPGIFTPSMKNWPPVVSLRNFLWLEEHD